MCLKKPKYAGTFRTPTILSEVEYLCLCSAESASTLFRRSISLFRQSHCSVLSCYCLVFIALCALLPLTFSFSCIHSRSPARPSFVVVSVCVCVCVYSLRVLILPVVRPFAS